MKRGCLIIVFLFTAIAVNAQYGVVNEAAFKTACGDLVPAPMKARATGYRFVLDTKSSAEGRPGTDYSSHSVTNYQDRSNWQRTRESTFGGKTTVIEEIAFGGKMYTRQNGGSWTEKVLQTDGRYPDAAPKVATRYLNIEYRIFPDEVVNGNSVRVCEKNETTIVTNTETKTEIQREGTVRYWVNDSGLLKSEHSFRNVGSGRTTTTWISNEWETDPAIKITPPILPAK